METKVQHLINNGKVKYDFSDVILTFARTCGASGKKVELSFKNRKIFSVGSFEFFSVIQVCACARGKRENSRFFLLKFDIL